MLKFLSRRNAEAGPARPSSGRRSRLVLLGVLTAAGWGLAPDAADAQHGNGQPGDWQRFYYYPYVYYPQNFQRPTQFDHLYYRYPPEQQIPVYNKSWYNFYPTEKPYHWGHHFILDVF